MEATERRGYLLSDIARRNQTLTFRSKLASNINTYITKRNCSQLLDQAIPDFNQWDANPAKTAYIKKSTSDYCKTIPNDAPRNTNGYYYYEGTGDKNNAANNKGRLLTIDSTIPPTSPRTAHLLLINKPTVLYVVGADIQIDSDIEYTQVLGTNPSLVIIAQKDSGGNGGNIYVNPLVQRIDATLIADGALMNGVSGVAKNWITDTLSNRLLINGKLFTYNTRGGSLKVDDTTLVSVYDKVNTPLQMNVGTCIPNTLVPNTACNYRDAAAQDLERFRIIPVNPSNFTCSLHVTGSLPAKKPDILTSTGY